MQGPIGHHADRAPPAGPDQSSAVDPYRRDQPAATAAPDTTATIIELSAFKRSVGASNGGSPAVPDDRKAQAIDLATSLREELQQARYREARRLKRVETLEFEVGVARAQNEALRAALESARSGAGETPATGGAVTSRPDPERVRRVAEIVRARKLGRAVMRLLRKRA